MNKKIKDSEFRLYGFILDKLKELGWRTQSLKNGGQVFAQNELANDPQLKLALGLKRPEYIVKLNEREYWTIEAKSSINDLDLAVKEAIGYANDINNKSELNCKIITGIAGSPDATYHIETKCLVGESWNILTINGRRATGFISPKQMDSLIMNGTGRLDEYDMGDYERFRSKTKNINKILHQGAINKRDRASVMACILLALAEDEKLSLSNNATRLIRDINTRAEVTLQKHNKKEYFDQIKITLPPSQDNHMKYRAALCQTIDLLRDLNIASAIDSGIDVLGEFYEQFLKYANDANELGIVFTPRHITEWAAKLLDVKYDDIVFDPACGTGGFLVAALDKVKRDKNNLHTFKSGNFYGIDNDPVIATLAIVNMIFRGDGSSNIIEGDSLNAKLDIKADKVLMNPPFALENAFEWEFVDVALKFIKDDGWLFAVLPTSVMTSTNNKREELSWRKNMLKEHTLKAVITLPEDLFYPNVSKGTHAIILQCHRPHNVSTDKVVWATLKDDEVRTKTQNVSQAKGNMNTIAKAIGNYIATQTVPDPIRKELDCSLLDMESLECAPEMFISQHDTENYHCDVSFVKNNLIDGKSIIDRKGKEKELRLPKCGLFNLTTFFKSIKKGNSGRVKTLPLGSLPLISTSEFNNGISSFVDKNSVNVIYPPGTITISSNRGSCCAFYHDYEYAANPDVFVLDIKDEYKEYENFGIFICAAINGEKWRYNYYRKFNSKRLSKLEIRLPINDLQEIDFNLINEIVKIQLTN